MGAGQPEPQAEVPKGRVREPELQRKPRPDHLCGRGRRRSGGASYLRSDHQCGKDRRWSDNAWELLNSRECGEVKRESNRCRSCPLGRTRVRASTSKLQLGGLPHEAAANCAAWHRRSDCEERRENRGGGKRLDSPAGRAQAARAAARAGRERRSRGPLYAPSRRRQAAGGGWALQGAERRGEGKEKRGRRRELRQRL